MKFISHSNSPEQTEEIAVKIGQHLKGGEVIQLIGDLGGGKTTFVKGLARGLGSSDTVSSPTFTINRIYEGPGLTLFHFDFYRLNNPGVMTFELNEVLNDPKNVLVIEWSDIVKHLLPEHKLSVKFEVNNNQEGRKLTFNYPSSLSYLIG